MPQRTFSIVKPDAVRKGFTGAILAEIAGAGEIAQLLQPCLQARRPARTLRGQLWSAETRTLLRDASTPAQLGTLSAVAALYLSEFNRIYGTGNTPNPADIDCHQVK